MDRHLLTTYYKMFYNHNDDVFHFDYAKVMCDGLTTNYTNKPVPINSLLKCSATDNWFRTSNGEAVCQIFSYNCCKFLKFVYPSSIRLRYCEISSTAWDKRYEMMDFK